MLPDVSLNRLLRALGYRTEPASGAYRKHVVRVVDGVIVHTGTAWQNSCWLAGVEP